MMVGDFVQHLINFHPLISMQIINREFMASTWKGSSSPFTFREEKQRVIHLFNQQKEEPLEQDDWRRNGPGN